jgi:hypothetical protein
MFSFNVSTGVSCSSHISRIAGESPFAFANQVYVVAAACAAEVKTRHGGFGG